MPAANRARSSRGDAAIPDTIPESIPESIPETNGSSARSGLDRRLAALPPVLRQLVRFGMAGGLGTATNLALFFVLVDLGGLPPMLGMLLCFAVAFRNFARVESEQSVTVRGLVWSIGMPLFTFALFQMGRHAWAAATPLGGVFMLSLPAAERANWIRCTTPTIWLIAGTVAATSLISSLLLLKSAVGNFDREIHKWFEANLVRGVEDKTNKKARRPSFPRWLVPVASR